MFTITRNLPLREALNLWRDSAMAYGGMHPAEVRVGALQCASEEDKIAAEIAEAWEAIPEEHRCGTSYPAQGCRLSGGHGKYEKEIRLTYGGGRSTVSVNWIPGQDRGTLEVAWIPFAGAPHFWTSDEQQALADALSKYESISVEVEERIRKACRQQRLWEATQDKLERLDPHVTWREFEPRLSAAGFAIIDLYDARRALECAQSVREYRLECALRYTTQESRYRW